MIGRRTAFIAFAGLSSLALSACSGATAEVNRCIQGGESREACLCLAETTRKSLEPELYRVVQLGGEGKDDAAQSAYNALKPEQQLKFTAVVRAVRDACKDKGAIPFNPGPSFRATPAT